jgi:tetrathionate reductase subunit B
LDAGLAPACVETCPTKAMIFGDKNDTKSEVAQVLATNATAVIKKEMQTNPHVFYISADETVMSNVEKEINYRTEGSLIKLKF